MSKLPAFYTMSGAEFQCEVGVDPEKWALAFVQWGAAEMPENEIIERASHVTRWFRDAMDAARKDAQCPPA